MNSTFDINVRDTFQSPYETTQTNIFILSYMLCMFFVGRSKINKSKLVSRYYNFLVS